MDKEKFKEFAGEFKWLFDHDYVFLYEEDMCDIMLDVFHTINVDYDLKTSWSEEFGCKEHYIKPKRRQDTSECKVLSKELDYLVHNGVCIVKDRSICSAIHHVLEICEVKHHVEQDKNFDDEDIWLVHLEKAS